jgi:hypothetical protein
MSNEREQDGVLLTETSHSVTPKRGRSRAPAEVKSSLQETVIEGRVTRRLRGMIIFMPLTLRVPPERMSEILLTVALTPRTKVSFCPTN